MKKWLVPFVVMIIAAAGVQAGEKGSMTKDEFIAMQQKRAEKNGKEFDAKKAEAAFAKKDTNGDGVLSAEEQAAGKGNKEGGAKKQKAESSEE